jgi:hypothetical protein
MGLLIMPFFEDKWQVAMIIESLDLGTKLKLPFPYGKKSSFIFIKWA